MNISLKNYTLKYLLFSILLLIAVWAGLFYAFILDEVYDNVDDGLKNQKIEIIREAYANKELLKTREFGVNQFRITPITKNRFTQKDELKNEMIFMPYDNEMEPYRVLKTHFLDHDSNAYQLEIRTSTVEEDDLLLDLAIALGVLYVLLIVSIYVTNLIVLRKAFRPFQNIIEQLKSYRFGEKNTFQLPKTNVSEFHTLSDGITRMLNDNQESFTQQKSFIENASHELKTPISIIQNKLDWMIENEELQEKNILQLAEIKKTTKRMSDLVTSLLMLSKIENSQFIDETEIEINSLIKKIIEDSVDWLDYKNLNLNLTENSVFLIKLNKNLAGILLNNLFQNALKYTQKNGNIHITIDQNAIIFSNTSEETALDKNHIFNRFYKKSEDSTSAGLGLSIVQSIINQNKKLSIDYYFKENMHHFRLSAENS